MQNSYRLWVKPPDKLTGDLLAMVWSTIVGTPGMYRDIGIGSADTYYLYLPTYNGVKKTYWLSDSLPSEISLSRISHAKMVGFSRLYCSIFDTTAGVATLGLLPPIRPGGRRVPGTKCKVLNIALKLFTNAWTWVTLNYSVQEARKKVNSKHKVFERVWSSLLLN